jgi:hypothetical protein
MSHSLQQLEDEIFSLPDADKAKLAETLLESLQPIDPQIEAAWSREIEEHVAALELACPSIGSRAH